MGKYSKWIGGGVGWFLGGPLGALFGFFVGSIFDTPSSPGRSTRYRGRTYTTTSGDFTMSFLVLIAAVMKADGKVVKAELDYVKTFFIMQFGETKSREALLLLREMLKKEIPVSEVCRQIKVNMEYSSRLQLIHMLYYVSNADGTIHRDEIKMIEMISGNLSISSKDYESIKNMFIQSTDSSYKILEVDPSVDDSEVKRAYRRMARKYHPDTVSHLGEDVRLVAEEKFKKLNEAYEKIKKERNII